MIATKTLSVDAPLIYNRERCDDDGHGQSLTPMNNCASFSFKNQSIVCIWSALARSLESLPSAKKKAVWNDGESVESGGSLRNWAHGSSPSRQDLAPISLTAVRRASQPPPVRSCIDVRSRTETAFLLPACGCGGWTPPVAEKTRCIWADEEAAGVVLYTRSIFVALVLSPFGSRGARAGTGKDCSYVSHG